MSILIVPSNNSPTAIITIAASKPKHLSPSELGTKEYWDSTYTTDLSTHALNPAYTGTDWFSDSLASQKVCSYLSSPSLHLPPTTTFLDLGTGNGEMLFRLREHGSFTSGKMLGVDYSLASVELARRIAKQKDLENIEFELWDFMGDEKPWLGGGFDVVLDKGTFDAVSLSAEEDGDGRRICEGYRFRVEGMIKPGGRFLITSCNWTEKELGEWFGGGGLALEGKLEYPTFSFGGMKGQSVYSVCFRREGEN